MEPWLAARDLEVVRGGRVVLSGVSFALRGRCAALAGANGAGGFRVEPRLEAGRPGIRIIARTHGVELERELGLEFFRSADYRRLLERFERLGAPLTEGAYMARGGARARSREGQDESEAPGKRTPIGNWEEAFDRLMADARQGVDIQRYKGLGEMNPDQLWETTMDPARRRLLQVRLEDAVAADDLFATLMGDSVEPRRRFIEDNALSVANLDA